MSSLKREIYKIYNAKKKEWYKEYIENTKEIRDWEHNEYRQRDFEYERSLREIRERFNFERRRIILEARKKRNPYLQEYRLRLRRLKTELEAEIYKK